MYPLCYRMQVDLSFNPNSQLKREATSKSGIARWLDGKGGDRGLQGVPHQEGSPA